MIFLATMVWIIGLYLLVCWNERRERRKEDAGGEL